MKGMILAAGIGSRLKPWTDHHPKALAPIGDRPAIEYVLLNMKQAGINEIIVNVHHFSNQVVDYLNSCPIPDLKIYISDETEELLDTGGAIVHAAEIIGNHSVLVHNADIYTNIDLGMIIKEHFLRQNDVTLLISNRESSRQLVFDCNQHLKGWINKKTFSQIPENLAILPADHVASFNGIHILSPNALSQIKHSVTEKKFPILPVYIKLMNDLKITGFLCENTNYSWIDIGTPQKLEQACKQYKSQSAGL